MPVEQPLPATERQVLYAQQIALRTGAVIPRGAAANRSALSAWIDANKSRAATNRFASYPSSKQVAFAERIARIKRSEIPRECFHDRLLMSKWIDGNKPR